MLLIFCAVIWGDTETNVWASDDAVFRDQDIFCGPVFYTCLITWLSAWADKPDRQLSCLACTYRRGNLIFSNSFFQTTYSMSILIYLISCLASSYLFSYCEETPAVLKKRFWEREIHGSQWCHVINARKTAQMEVLKSYNEHPDRINNQTGLSGCSNITLI